MTAWVTAMILRDAYWLEHTSLTKRLRTEQENRVGYCERCGVCCWQRPPALSCDDLSRFAKWRGLSPSEFFQRFCVVDDPGNHSLGPVLMRRHQKRLRGRWLPMRETYSIASPCVFLGKKGCVCHEVKPQACERQRCWAKCVPTNDYGWTLDQLRSLGWDGHKFDPEDYDD